MRIDPFSLKRRSAATFSKTFTDPDVPGAELALSIRRLDMPQQMAALDAVDRLVERHIDGTDEMGPLPVVVDGQPVELSRTLLMQCVFLERMQTAPVGERYGVLDWIALSVTMPAAYEAASKWATRIQRTGNDLPNDSTEAAAPSSPPASESSDSIPSTSNEPTPSLTASTTDSGGYAGN